MPPTLRRSRSRSGSGFSSRALALVLLIGAAGPVSAQDRRDYYCTDTTPQDWAKVNSTWMQRVPDTTSLSALSIPGTHDTCARYGGDAVACQSWSLADQFAVGIRFLDIRCRQVDNAFAIHHDLVYQHLNFGDVQQACIDFLTAHPSECIVMNLQQEYSHSTTWAATFKESYLKGNERYWYTKATIPTLGEVRGKIVLVTSETDIGGIPWSTLSVQNDWTVATVFDIPSKWDKVQAELNDANAGSPSKWHLNFASAAGGGAYPYTVGEQLNKRLYNYLSSTGTSCKRVGTVLMNFPGEKLIDHIIGVNFGLADYTVTVYTGDVSGAGTDANIFLTITGTRGSTGEQRLNGLISGNAFERDQTDKCVLHGLPSVGEITSITVRSDDSFAGSAWYLGWVEISSPGVTTRRFTLNDWIKAGQLTRTLSPG